MNTVVKFSSWYFDHITRAARAVIAHIAACAALARAARCRGDMSKSPAKVSATAIADRARDALVLSDLARSPSMPR